MQYREFGKTGKKISVLGLGAMRLPSHEKDGKWRVNEEEAVKLIQRTCELGVNYIDTAYMYHEGESESVVGKGLKGIRDKMYISSKLPHWDVREKNDTMRILHEQLTKLDTEYIDFYHVHALSEEAYNTKFKELNIMDDLIKAKEEGLIRHLSFSFHDSKPFMRELIDTGIFESLLCQYNFLDRNYEEEIEYAHKKGLGTVVMGPVGGGRLAFPSDMLTKATGNKFAGTYELALRFVLANPNVSCALSGMSSIEQLEANVKVASNEDPLSKNEWDELLKMVEQSKSFSDLYCTGCNYCNGCPSEIKIADIFRFVNYKKIYGLDETARVEYLKLEKKAGECTECGYCESKCPQKINIIEQLRKVEEAIGV